MPDRPCPCCTGQMDGFWPDLCDLCVVASLEHVWDHGCSRPADCPPPVKQLEHADDS